METGRMTDQDRHRRFSFERLLNIELPQQKSLAVTEADIERFLQSAKGPSAFLVLSLLYPQLRYNEVELHQDHIHPAAGFTELQFQGMGIPKEQWQEWWDSRDCVPNLQLMNGRQNISKNATPLKEWVGKMSESEQATFACDNYFPETGDLEFKDFMTFFKERKKVLRDKLKKVLALTSDRPAPVLAEWNDHDDEIEPQEARLTAGTSGA